MVAQFRTEEVANIQLWEANDYNHRLHPEKLTHIIELSEKVLHLKDLEIEVEYQGETIGKFGLDYSNGIFMLTNTQTGLFGRRCLRYSTPRRKKTLVSFNTECMHSRFWMLLNLFI